MSEPTWHPKTLAEFRDGIADALFCRDPDCDSWEKMAGVVIECLQAAGIPLPPDEEPSYADKVDAPLSLETVKALRAELAGNYAKYKKER